MTDSDWTALIELLGEVAEESKNDGIKIGAIVGVGVCAAGYGVYKGVKYLKGKKNRIS